ADFASLVIVVPTQRPVVDVGVGGRLSDLVRGRQGHAAKRSQAREDGVVAAGVSNDRVVDVRAIAAGRASGEGSVVTGEVGDTGTVVVVVVHYRHAGLDVDHVQPVSIRLLQVAGVNEALDLAADAAVGQVVALVQRQHIDGARGRTASAHAVAELREQVHVGALGQEAVEVFELAGLIVVGAVVVPVGSKIQSLQFDMR